MSGHINAFGFTLYISFMFQILFVIAGAILYVKKVKVIHESGVAIILGIIVSAIMHLGFKQQYSLDERLFFYIFLPPIIFAEGFSL